MRSFLLLLSFFLCSAFSIASPFVKDSLILIPKDPAKGFQSDYLLFIPKGFDASKKTTLLVEPNNTGKLSDSIDVHQQAAIFLATKSSVGNNISTELHIPLLVPIFPRPASKELVYTHALDRDVMLEKTPELQRLDLQLLAMVEDAQKRLAALSISVDANIFMSGFSASATFINRFSMLHPERIRALAIGGFNGELMLPQKAIGKTVLNYPIGTNDFELVFQQAFDLSSYRAIPQFMYMGALDNNDAVQYDDAYSEEERKIINEQIAATVQERYRHCQELYQAQGIQPIFKSYEQVGHWTTSQMNLAVILFFQEQLNKQ